MKKVLFILFLSLALFVTGCGANNKNVKGNLEEIMEKVYKGIPEEKRPMMLSNTVVTKENMEGYLGTKDIKFKEAIASESMTGSIAHSVVLVRMNNVGDAQKVKEKIKQSANPRKWICVEAENVYVESKGDLVILIMTNEMADTLRENFNNL